MLTTPDPTVVMARFAARWSLLSLPITLATALLWRGSGGALAALTGSLLVTAFFAFGVLGVNVLITALPGLAVVGAFAVYATQLMVLLLVLAVARDHAGLDRTAFAFGAVAGTMVWQVAHSRAFIRTRQPMYAPAPKEEL